MGFNEFKELLAVINAWKQNFINIDHDRSGTVEHHELNQAIAAMGKNIKIIFYMEISFFITQFITSLVV